MSRLRLTLFGGLEVQRVPHGPLTVPTRKAQALLAYLALSAGHAQPRDKLAALLWPDTSPGVARTALRQTLFVLRKALGSSACGGLVMTGDAIGLAVEAVETDVAAFEQALAEGTPPALEAAASLYRGDLLAGLAIVAPTFEEWLMSERERLRERALEVFARLLAHQRTVGATAPAVQSALRLLALDPLQEAVHRALMRLYVQLGRRDTALRQYQDCVDILRREVAVEPEAETNELYQEILRQRPVRGAVASVSLSSADTPLVGRQLELTLLHEALAEAWADRGRVVAVIGEAGIGKSRLLNELAAEAGRRAGSLLVARAYESEQILPLGPWVTALRAAGIPSDPRLLNDLENPWRTELARVLPELANTGRPAETGPPDQLRLFESLGRLLRRLALDQPLLILLEDCHWADDMSLRFLAFCARRLDSVPILFAISVRDEELLSDSTVHRTLEELATEDRLSRIVLSRLGRDDTLTLVRLLAPANSGESVLIQQGDQVWNASEGNPFIVIETMRAMAEDVALARSGSLPLPARVRDVIAGRLDRLSDPARELASIAAVIGREFEFSLLHQASGLDEQRAAEGVEELVRRRVLRAVGERFGLVHERILEVVRDRLLSPRRMLIHRQVAAALEKLYANDLAPHYAALAVHYRECQTWDEAVKYLHLAGRQALDRAAHQEALVFLEQALDALQRLPDTLDNVERAIDVRIDLRNAMHPIADATTTLSRLCEAENLAVRLGDRSRLGRVLCHLADQFGNVGDYERAVDAAERALALADALEDLSLRIVANTRLGRVHHARGEYELAIDCFTRNVEALTGPFAVRHFGMLQPPSIHSRIRLVGSLVELGRFGAAREVAESALQIARTLDHPRAASFAAATLGFLELRIGRPDVAIELLEPALAHIRDLDSALWFPHIAASLGYAYALSGRTGEGASLLERVADRAVTMKWNGGRCLMLSYLAETYLLSKRDREAAETAALARDLAHHHDEHGDEAWSLRLLGEIAARDGRLRDAETRFHEALVLAESLGMQPLVARCHHGLARLYRTSGDDLVATAEATTASALFKMLGMTISTLMM